MNYYLALPLFFQALFLVLRRVAPESVKLTSLFSKLLIVSVLILVYSLGNEALPIGFNLLIFTPLALEYLAFSSIEDRLKSNVERISILKFSEVSLTILFFSVSAIEIESKLCLLIGAFFLDSLRSSTAKQTTQTSLIFFSTLLSGLLTIGLLGFGLDSAISKGIILLLLPMNYFFLPFSLIKGRGSSQIYSLGQRVLSILLITEFSASSLYFGPINFVLPIVFIGVFVSLFNKDLLSVLKSGRLGIELFLILVLAYFPGLSTGVVASDYFWACFFLCVPYLLFAGPVKVFNKYSLKIVGALLLLGVLPGPFFNIIGALVEVSRLEGSYSLLLLFLISFLSFIVALFTRLTLFTESDVVKRSFGQFNSILLGSSIIIGVILSI
jgi:hypothetical protein